jgi:hypothetical protein
MSDANSESVVAREVRIVDEEGRCRLLLSAEARSPIIEVFHSDGRAGFSVSLDAAGRAAVKLSNSDPSGPTATLEVVDSGTHVKFTRAGGAAGYLFLNNAGGSGVALIDGQGVRRLMALAPADGNVRFERFGPDGKALPLT